MTRHSISEEIETIESARMVRGHGRFTDDVSCVGQCHAVFLRSSHAHAEILSLNTDAARAMPGVIAVLDDRDWQAAGLGEVPGSPPPRRSDGSPGYRPPRPPFARGRLMHVGQIIAVVIAETAHQARDAVEAIEVDVRDLPALIDYSSALSTSPLWPEAGSNEAYFAHAGNAAGTDAAIKAAPRVVRETFRVSRISANPMEPRAIVAEYEPGADQITLWACQQRQFRWRTLLAGDLFKVPESRLRVIACDVGGSFGMKGALYSEAPIIAWAAKTLRRPVKWLCDRSEAQAADENGRDIVMDAQLAFDDAGKFLGYRVDGTANAGAFLTTYGFGTAIGSTKATCGPYAMPVAYGRAIAVFSNTSPLGHYRGPGQTPGVYVLERLIDMAARDLGMDPVEIRRRNLIASSALPMRVANGTIYDCGDFDAVMQKCLRLADYEGVESRRDEAARRGRLLGVGVSSIIDPSAGHGAESIELRFDTGGAVTVLAGSSGGGQGHETVYTQIVSQLLGIEAERIRVIEGDTSVMPWGEGTGAARTATMSGSALAKAADKIVEKGRRIAAHLLEADQADMAFENGMFSIAGTDRSVSITEVARAAFIPGRLPVDIEFGLDATASWIAMEPNIPNAFHVCEVEIDPETGVTELVRYSAVHDVGVELNPEIVRGQQIGGIAQSAGQALMEQVIFDPESGQLLTGSFMDYAMPRASDLCNMDIASHPVPTDTNPLGVKGAGETGTVGGLAAIMNAVNDALAPLGIRNLGMPATPERVWHAIQEAEAARSS